ncbi:Endoplasmic reticulum oxidoreductin 1 [Penicillium brevicompactum]|uniref:Endoplasmic reticulum oxidoreductin 1 n=1 Tax=Penicillium brevicompactum TaxID=5074 RepID=A0A9W9RVP6_PENBR|nr:Endoplasmic reticulum oxidoreductin 1 [Penicillium brevicompactum]KAJ5347906.1 Endoplasmic reticulum oxidoreductin 1 [Penicillium brevicompactum]KAJ5367231.1 Endoplasmic reticulum oxidoreductin 1 [Penicillium brevicompactum]
MQPTAKFFHVAVLGLAGLASASTSNHDASLDPTKCALEPSAMVSDACVSYGEINGINDLIFTTLNSITQETDFFSFYRLNLFNTECPFWSDANSMCGNIACSVNTIESEDDIPLTWRAEELSKLEGPKANHPPRKIQAQRPKERPLQGELGEDVGESCVVEYDDECDDRDYCVPEDEGSTGKGDYVSLVDNPERFTGYMGEGAHQVWNAIYSENCFMKPMADELEDQTLNVPLGGLQAASDFRDVLHKKTQRPEGLPLDNECLEKRVFHRLISGMHASISTHLCWDYLNQTTGQWHPNVQCFKERLLDHPERISNMYFNYALVSRAVTKLRKHLNGYTFCTSDPAQDRETKKRVNKLTSTLSEVPQIFDEKIMFQDPGALGLKEDFRNRFRNVSRLMDCVGCDKCRLWGKLQVNGYGTALKVLFDYDETKNGENPPLRRTELVALINTLGRISHSIAASRSMQRALLTGTTHMFPVHGAVPSSHHANALSGQGGKRVFKDGNNNFYYEDEGEEDYIYGREQVEHYPWERKPLGPDAGVWDDIKQEWDMVWGTVGYIWQAWMDIPRTLFQIGTWESIRLYNYWLGLPVPPRAWKLKAPEPRPHTLPNNHPRRDEL